MTTDARRWFGVIFAVVYWLGFSVNASAQKIALLSAESPALAADVRAKLTSAGLADVTIIDVADVGTLPLPPTPTLAELLQYDAILTWSDEDYAAPGPLGDVLADYVDSGRGVVQAVFSFHPTLPMRLDGRWRTEAYEPFSFSAARRLAGMTLVATQPLHPILSGVASFNGGSSGFHGIVTPRACAEVVAHWSNGQPLVAARLGPRGGRVIGLNFFPPSSDVGAAFWISATDGGILMANALRFAARPSPARTGPIVALLGSDETPWIEDVRCKLQDLQLFTRVDSVNVLTATPALGTLLDYDAVLTWSNYSYNNGAALGDILADYVDQDNGVVQSAFSFDAEDTTRSLAGRWTGGGYRPLTEAPVVMAENQTLVPQAPDHEILSNVSGFNGGMRSFHSSPVALGAATTLVASWSDGQPLAAAGTGPVAGRVVGLNLYPPSSDARFDFWDSTTDGARLIGNALLYAANASHPPTAEAGENQTEEATSPAGASFTLNATANDPDGDPLTYSWSGAVLASGASVIVDLPPPVAPTKAQTYTLLLTVTDGRGGEVMDTIDLTVTDMTAPVLHGLPLTTVTAEATSASGASVEYGPVTAMDAVDGDRSVDCSHPSGLFPIGDTAVTCSTSDSRGNSSSETFTVRVTDVPEPGAMHGHGFIGSESAKHEFAFAVRESASGQEWAGLLFRVKAKQRAHHAGDGNFIATSADFVRFDGNTVLFVGTGLWNGAAGFRYEAFAVDGGTPGRYNDAVRISITAPGGAVVAHVDGFLGGGNVQSRHTSH
jgi:hypothetical protein